MKKYYEYQKAVSIILSFILIISTSGCYSVRGLTRNDIQYTNKTIFYLHGPTSYYKLSKPTISEGNLTGNIDYVASSPEKIKTIHIYAAPDSSIKKIGDLVNVPFANIVKVEEYSIDGLKTVIGVAGTISLAFLATVLIILIIKGASCPFIYADDGDNYQFKGEIYSGATALPLERDDYLPICNSKPVDNLYKLRITNEVDEIQKTNLTELVVIDHQPDTRILMDKYGTAHSISDLKMPSYATDAYGSTILNELAYRDSLRYISTIKRDQNIKDTISLSFDKPADVTSSKLVIKGKNTMWLDFMYGKFSDLFGKRFEKWKEKSDKKPREELLKWSFDQGIPLAVYLQTDTGLKFVDYFNLPGPMADKEDVLQIDLSQIHTDKVNLKLVSGVLFWDIDYVGMDFTSSGSINKTIIPLYKAVDENGKDVSSLLSDNDDEYLIQPLPVNKTDLSFIAPESVPGLERAFFLHSKGHYEILRDTKGKPDIAYLKTFLEPGAFIKFSKDHFLEYYYKSN
jgi:hypothetical protein